MRLTLSLLHLFIGVMLVAIPNLTRREILFAVPVPQGFRDTDAARRAVAIFRIVVALATVLCVSALLLVPEDLLNATAAVVPLVLVAATGISFYLQNRKLAPAAVQHTRAYEAELSDAPDRLPGYWPLVFVPVLLFGAAALYLDANWDQIPERFPIHWGADGQPNRWAPRSLKGVFGPLLFGVMMSGWFTLMLFATWFGSRRTRMRSVMFGGMMAIHLMLALLFSLLGANVLLRLPPWVIALAPMTVILPIIIAMVRKMSEAGEPMDPTPNECWKAGIIYYNPNDAALFVEKREGFGYTFNFANRWVWGLLVGLAGVIAATRLVLP
ncbi:MAG: DUF1648 domain-containing protein [Bryobacterales bacterium]|nr:DUF1648 domain-containing protein [Bryobacterales bacterium]